jgi:hypothetical protein
MSSLKALACPSWLAVSATTQDLLVTAAHSWDDPATSELCLRQALAQPEVELDALVGAYRYYFYKNNDSMALEVATRLCDRIQKAQQWPPDWDSLKPILQSHLEDLTVRLYLSAYTASGLVLARLGCVEAAQTIARQMQQLNAKEFGADVLFSTLNPSPDEDEDEDEDGE